MMTMESAVWTTRITWLVNIKHRRRDIPLPCPSFFQNDNPTEVEDAGPVNALSSALAMDLGRYQKRIADWRLVDFKVRITNGGTEAVTRVIIDSEDDQGRRWSTVGVSANIVDASFAALVDAIRWKLVQEGA